MEGFFICFFLNHERYKGAWACRWECNPSSITVMLIKCSFVFYSNKYRKNTNDNFVVQIGKKEKKCAQQNLEIINSSSHQS